MIRLSRVIACGALACLPAFGCAASESASAEVSHDDLESVQSALLSSDPVSKAVTQECSTYSVRALSLQLIAELQCLKPGAIKSIEGAPGVVLGDAVFPYFQTPAANAVLAAQKARGRTLIVNSALRTLAQQFLLYRWYELGRCGIPLAAPPGRSNHESALALDIEDSQAWRTALSNQSFRWLGANDPVHYDYDGSKVIDIRGASVEAFQRLWNRNHPEDRIDEDGAYGPGTAMRIEKSPVGGFTLGATCGKIAEPNSGTNTPANKPGEAPGQAVPPASAEPGTALPPASNVPADATADSFPVVPKVASDAPENSTSVNEISSGCNTAPTPQPVGTLAPLGAITFAFAFARAFRRSRQRK